MSDVAGPAGRRRGTALRPRRHRGAGPLRPALAVADDPSDADRAAPRRAAGPGSAIAGGPAFTFVYPDNLEALEAAGAELVPFDPRDRSASSPEALDGLYAGGGFPEVFAPELAANRPLLDDVRDAARPRPGHLAECGGLLWLSRSLDGHAMAGVVARRRRHDRPALPRLPAGGGPAPTRRWRRPARRLRGHEFHYSTIDPAGDALDLTGRFGQGPGGFASPRLLASYLHLHFGADPVPAQRFVATCATPAG